MAACARPLPHALYNDFCTVEAIREEARRRQPSVDMNEVTQIRRTRPAKTQSADSIQLYRILKAILPSDSPQGKDGFFIRYFFGKMQLSPDLVHYVLVEGAPLIIIPGESNGRVHLFDAGGKLLDNETFQTGWRITVTGGQLIRDSRIGVPVIELFTGAMINGRDVEHQYYGVLNDRVVLIRLEDSRGHAIRNISAPNNGLIGPEPPDRTQDEWEKALMSDDQVELLQALMWVEELPTNLRSRDSVKRRLNELRGNQNSWIREAAELALGVSPH